MNTRLVPAVAVTALALGVAACGSSGGSSSKDAAAQVPSRSGTPTTRRKWPGASRWSAPGTRRTPTEKVTGQEIPTGKGSESVIGASITAGNAPCLVFNTSPAAVPQFQKQGGLVALDDMPGGKAYVDTRTGAPAKQYQSPDGKYYQLPWKANPVMIFYNKKLMKKAGVNPEHPPLATYAQFLDTAARSSRAAPVRRSTRRRRASSTNRGSTSTRCSSRRAASSWYRAARRSSTRPRASRSRTSGRPSTARGSPRRRSTTATRSPTARPPWPSSDRGRSPSTATRSTGASRRCPPRPEAGG